MTTESQERRLLSTHLDGEWDTVGPLVETGL